MVPIDVENLIIPLIKLHNQKRMAINQMSSIFEAMETDDAKSLASMCTKFDDVDVENDIRATCNSFNRCLSALINVEGCKQ